MSNYRLVGPSVEDHDDAMKIFTGGLLLTLGLLLATCQSKIGISNDDHHGSYTLATVDGLQLPATVTHDDVEIKVQSGTFTINADGTCLSRTIFGPPSGADITRDVSATYTLNDSTMTMQWEGAGQTTGTISDGFFSMNNEGMIFVYEKQPAPSLEGE